MLLLWGIYTLVSLLDELVIGILIHITWYDHIRILVT